MTFQFEITVFKDLLETYPTWEALQVYLESKEGGMFRIVDRDDKGLCLIRYEKGHSIMDLPHSHWFRSVIWNTTINRPVCIAPCKTSSDEFPYQTIKEMESAGVICQEQLEGFMINCFHMQGDPELHITSRSKLHATGTFYSKKTFRELFMESYEDTFHEKPSSDHSPFLKPAEKEVSVFYSFLVQHKEHKIVKNNTANRVYVIYKGIVYEDGLVRIEDTPFVPDVENVLCIPIKQSSDQPVDYADVVSRSVQIEAYMWARQFIAEQSHEYQGIVLKDLHGNRWRIRSERYSAILSLRGNHPSIRNRFCHLYTSNLIPTYLEYYPEESEEMNRLLSTINIILYTLFEIYLDVYVQKSKKRDEIDKMFHPHLYAIHGIYLNQLRPLAKRMTLHDVQVYLCKQPWQRLSFLIQKRENESAVSVI